MMTPGSQPEIDLAGDTVETQWRRNELEDAKNWTEEAMCLQWLSGKNAPDWDWWKGLKNYEREGWLSEYRYQRSQVECGMGMEPAWYVIAGREESFRQTAEIAEKWAKEIRTAFVERRPCPIIPSRGFEHVLSYAFEIAQVPEGCLSPAE